MRVCIAGFKTYDKDWAVSPLPWWPIKVSQVGSGKNVLGEFSLYVEKLGEDAQLLAKFDALADILEDTKELTKDEIKYFFYDQWLPRKYRDEIDRIQEEMEKNGTWDWNKYDSIRKPLAKKAFDPQIKEFMDNNKGRIILGFEYSDNDGPLHSAIEHAPVFYNIPYKQVYKRSNH